MTAGASSRIDSGGGDGVTAVKLLAAAVTARAPRERLTRLGESEATTTRGLHVRATSSCNCLRTNANPSALQSLQHLKTSYNTLTLLHVTRSHICDRDRRIPFPTQPKSYILGPTKPRCGPTSDSTAIYLMWNRQDSTLSICPRHRARPTARGVPALRKRDVPGYLTTRSSAA